MTDRQIIIDDQKKTIHRLQDECTEKTNAIIALGEQLKAKEQECETLASQLDFEVQKKECLEQECEELKKIINEAKNSKLDLNSFFAIEATVGEYQLELDQLKEQLEAYKMESEEGTEINAELKAENDELKKTVDDLLHKPEIQDKILWKIDNEALLGSKDAYIYKLKQTLTEIKEIGKNVIKNVSDRCIETTPMYYIHKQILQKISECEGNNEYS